MGDEFQRPIGVGYPTLTNASTFYDEGVDADRGSTDDALSIRQLYDRVDGALNDAFPVDELLWVTGEISKLSISNGHCYIDLIDPTDRSRTPGTLSVKIWKNTWLAIFRSLSTEGLNLDKGMSIRILGSVDFYRPRGQFGFVVRELDVTQLLGQLAKARADLIVALRQQGALDANKQRPLSDLPLRVGLVASRATEGCSDFLGQLDRSGFAFQVILANSTMQGQQCPSSVAQSISSLCNVMPALDLIVVVRGGGAKSDLAAFDDAQLVRAIANSTIPVWTGIGHTGDESIADLAAHVAFATPTACGAAIAERVGVVHHEVVNSAIHVANVANQRMAEAEVDQRRRQSAVVALASATLGSARRSVRELIERLARASDNTLARVRGDVDAAARFARSSGIEQQLGRGFSITRTASGSVVRDIGDLTQGDEITTTFAFGTVTSTVTAVQGRVPTIEEQS